MIEFLPGKHVRLNETIIGLGAVLLGVLKESKTLDELWDAVRQGALGRSRTFEDSPLTSCLKSTIRRISRFALPTKMFR